MTYVFLILGFIMLVKGADFFVDGSSSIAKKLKIPALIIGLTIVAFGTSAPEAAVSITAAVNGNNDIAMANIIGSNIFNILAVIGFAAMVRPMRVQKSIIIKEFPFALLSYALLFVLAFDIFICGFNKDLLSRADGIVLLMVFSIFMYSLIIFAINSKDKADENEEEIKQQPMLKSVIFTIGGMALIIIGGQFVVNNAVKIATDLGLSENLIGLTIVSIGTSLPELVTSIVAAKKGENDIAIGNVIGSNIFNVFFVLGISATISPVPVSGVAFTDIIIMGVVSLVVYAFAITNKKINRIEGAILLMLYLAYTAFVIIR